MIKLILECLKLNMPTDSETVAIAKGKYKLIIKKSWLKR